MDATQWQISPFMITTAECLDEGLVWVRLAGDVDMISVPALACATDRLVVIAPHTIVVDLTAVTFAGSTLVNFLVHLRNHVVADPGVLAVYRPTVMTRQILELAGVNAILTICEDPPAVAVM